MVDFFETAVGLHVNGKATIVENDAVEAFGAALRPARRSRPAFAESPEVKKTPERWVVVAIDEAYVHCSKHIPMLRSTRRAARPRPAAARVTSSRPRTASARGWQPTVCAPSRAADRRGPASGDGRAPRARAPTASARATTPQPLRCRLSLRLADSGAVRHVGPPSPLSESREPS